AGAKIAGQGLTACLWIASTGPACKLDMFVKTYREINVKLLLHLACATLGLLAQAGPGLAESINVAVAANFTVPAEQIADAFEAETGTRVALSFGATGALFAQISQGAPFDLFLSADMARPELA